MVKRLEKLPLTEAVNLLLGECDLPATLTIEQCAIDLSMSATSFRRKLSQEETSYKLIQAKFLNELCVQALLTKQSNIDDLALKLGYSERATFERAFRQKFGITPSQFRELSLVDNKHECHKKLIEIAENMPPMSNSCRLLLNEKEQGNLNLQRVVEIVNKDAIFSARIMGQASKAIYGKTPNSLLEAISRNLGITTVVNYAIVFAMQDALQEQVEQVIIDQYSKAFMIAPKFFQLIRKSVGAEVKFDNVLVEQVLVFALLGIFLLSHKSAYKHELMMYSLQGMDNLQSLNQYIRETMAISIFSSSSLMLSLWHVDANLVKQLNHLERITQLNSDCNQQDELILFMLSSLYFFAAGHKDFSELEQEASLLKIYNFSEIKDALFH